MSAASMSPTAQPYCETDATERPRVTDSPPRLPEVQPGPHRGKEVVAVDAERHDGRRGDHVRRPPHVVQQGDLPELVARAHLAHRAPVDRDGRPPLEEHVEPVTV